MRRWRSRITLGAWGIALAGLLGSFASAQGVVLDLENISITAARNAVRGYLLDFKHDLEDVEGQGFYPCGIYDGFHEPPSVPYPVELLRGLPAAAATYPKPMENLGRRVRLTSAESKHWERLMGTRPLDRAEGLKLVIDSEWFLIRVASRMYSEKIQEVKSSDFADCKRLALRRSRDQELIRSSQHLLRYYDALEREIDLQQGI